ncbi:reverse transcriptase domain-containing protein [Tanacetum coccineum]
MQSLSGKLATLNRFLSKAAERVIPCLDMLKRCTNKKDFCWTDVAEEAFQTMKKLIADLPTLTTPMKGEELMVYLSAANEAVSSVLIKVIMDKPINQILNSREASGRLAIWAIELGGFGITYAPRNAIKCQVLAPPDRQESKEEQTAAAPIDNTDTWKPYTDGASNDHGSGAGLILMDLEGMEYSYALRLNFSNSNNDAEYEALLPGLRIAVEMRVEKMHAFVDSKLVANQVEDSYEARAKKQRSTKENSWKWEYINKGTLPEDATEARTIKEKVKNYVIKEGILYQKSYLGPLLRCIGPHHANYVIREIHRGACEMHDGPRKVVFKAMSAGYYWSSMPRDANNEIRISDACQVYATVPRLPKDDMISVTSAWPFQKWGMDIVDPLPKAPGRLKYLIVVVDYFTKWFRVLVVVITDNGTQLIIEPFKS